MFGYCRCRNRLTDRSQEPAVILVPTNVEQTMWCLIRPTSTTLSSYRSAVMDIHIIKWAEGISTSVSSRYFNLNIYLSSYKKADRKIRECRTRKSAGTYKVNGSQYKHAQQTKPQPTQSRQYRPCLLYTSRCV